MSLQSLIKLRIQQRMAPDAVWVLVGNVPAWMEDTPATVMVRPGCLNFDFRALIGLHVDVFELGNHWNLLDKVMTALELAPPKSRGLACLAGVAGLNPAHELFLDKAHRMMQ